jgi:hypothetical protein
MVVLGLDPGINPTTQPYFAARRLALRLGSAAFGDCGFDHFRRTFNHCHENACGNIKFAPLLPSFDCARRNAKAALKIFWAFGK